jgi:hypothetical protein
LGQRVFIGFKARNTGNTTWYNSGDHPVRVGPSMPDDRISAFCDSTWLTCARVGNLKESSVEPGQIGTFEFWYQAPNTTGTFNEHFKPLAEGITWMKDYPSFYFYTVTKTPRYSWEPTSQYAYTNETKTVRVRLQDLAIGQRVFIGFKARNTGNTTWYNSGDHPVRVGPSMPDDRISAFCDSTWLTCARVGNLKESSVEPGQIGTFEFWYQAPNTTGTFNEHFKPLAEGITWMKDYPSFYFYTVTN